MNKINYQKKLEETLALITEKNEVPTLLLHSCCAPCSSYVIEYLSRYFSITVFYYNPNIYPDEEYYHRVKEQQAFIEAFPTVHPVSFIEGDFEKDRFYECAKGLEAEPETGARCTKCFELRLGETAKLASERGFDFFATTLTISPMKNAPLLNEIGERLSIEYGVKWLYSDFKKKEGYKRSTEISRQYNMYRQDYCGCVYSLRERRAQENM